jgi:predicted permease
MTFFRRLLLLLPWRRRAAERDMQEELSAIAAMARPRELGNLTQVAEDARAEWSWQWLDQLKQDLRHATRTLRRSPGFTAVAVVSLAFGIGANLVIFSVVDAALFRPLPYAHADRVVDLFIAARTPDGTSVRAQASGRQRDRLLGMPQLFDAVEGVDHPSSRALASGTGPDPMVGGFSPGLLDMLGAAPQLGRGFRDDDLSARDRVVISEAYWQRAFNRDPAVVGRTIQFADRTAVIVGVMPPTFRHFVGVSTDAWFPVGAAESRRLVARLRPGLTLAQAQREASASPEGRGMDLVSGDWWRAHGPMSVQGRSARAMLFSLLGAVGFLLAIACANVASLLLVRTSSRQREIAVRGALGATRARLARQFLTEGVLLTVLGGAAALTLAVWAIRILPAIVPADMAQIVFGVASPAIDWRAAAFGGVVAVLTACLSSVAPAWRASRPVAAARGAALGHRIAGDSHGERRARDVFQAIQVALTVVLLVGAGLLGASLTRLAAVPLGYDARNLGFAQMTLPRRVPLDDGQRASIDRLIARVDALPGVAAVTVGVPPTAGYTGGNFLAEVSLVDPMPSVPVELFNVRPDYFHVAGIRLSEGRLLGPEDRRNTPLVAVVSDNVARRFWPGQSAIGKQFTQHPGVPPVTIVGVVPRVRTSLLARETAVVYMASTQVAEHPNLLFRIDGDVGATLNAIRQELQAIGPPMTLERIGTVQTLSADVDPTAPARFYALLFGVFAGLAVLTATVGLYGLLSYSVGRRTQEIGVRIALGASTANVLGLVVLELLAPVAGGIVVGLIAASLLSEYLRSRLFEVEPGDPVVLAAVVVLFLAVAGIAALVPIRRATQVDPVDALRAE